MSFLISGAVGGIVYYVSCLIFPPRILPVGAGDDRQLEFEELAKSEGFLAGESMETITGVRVIEAEVNSDSASHEDVETAKKDAERLN